MTPDHAFRQDLKGRAAINAMASDMLMLAASEGAATRDDLARKGWDRRQLDLHGDAAREAAQARAASVIN